MLLIDDLVATGGTLAASTKLIKGAGGVVVECACVVELTFLNARKKVGSSSITHTHTHTHILSLSNSPLLLPLSWTMKGTAMCPSGPSLTSRC